jgi:hypothetical protein
MSNELPAYAAKPIPPEAPITSFGEVIDAKAALRNCEVGKAFTVDTNDHRQRIIGFAARLGIKIKTKRTLDGRYDVWRIE